MEKNKNEERNFFWPAIADIFTNIYMSEELYYIDLFL